MVKMRRGQEHALDDPQRLGPAAVAGEPQGDQRVVVRPDRAVVVRERVVAGVVLGHRPHPPPRPERLAHERVHDRVHALVRHDAAPQQMADVRAHRVDRPLVTIQRERVVAAAVLDPERLVEARLQRLRVPLEPGGELGITPHLARQLGRPALRVVHVPLHLARRDRRRRPTAVAESLRVPRVLP